MEDREVVVGEYVLLLRGRVIEVFHKTGLHDVFHVTHAAVEVKPRRDGDTDFIVGIDVLGRVSNGAKVRVSPDRYAEVFALFDEAKRRRG